MYTNIQLQLNVEYLNVFEILKTLSKIYFLNFLNLIAIRQH